MLPKIVLSFVFKRRNSSRPGRIGGWVVCRHLRRYRNGRNYFEAGKMRTARCPRQVELDVVRLVFAVLALLVLTRVAPAEEDNGPALVDLFVKTCALRPLLPSEMERIASGLGFASDGSPISADMETGSRIDILYMAELKKRGEKIASLTAYFDGPAGGPTVICSVTATGVSADSLPGLIEKSLNARDRIEKAPDNDRRMANWRMGAPGDDEKLEMSARRNSPRRASITIEYRGHKR